MQRANSQEKTLMLGKIEVTVRWERDEGLQIDATGWMGETLMAAGRGTQ